MSPSACRGRGILWRSGVTSPLKLLRSKIPSPPLPPLLSLPSTPSPHLPLEVGPLNQLGGLGRAISSPSGVWGEVPAAIDFGAFWGSRNTICANLKQSCYSRNYNSVTLINQSIGEWCFCLLHDWRKK